MLKSRVLTASLSLIFALAMLGNSCGASDPSDQASVSAQPGVSSPGSHRFLITDDATAGSEECTVNDQGGQDCVWDDGAGTICSYAIDASGALIEQHCSGDWGSYDCVNDSRAITCTYASGDSTCTDTWSQEGELVQSNCGYAETVPAEECLDLDDGTIQCTYDDGYTRCSALFNADGTIISQTCSDGSYSYDCLAGDGQVLCTLTLDGQQVCQDTYTPAGDPIALGCEQYFPDEPSDPGQPEPECTVDDAGVTTCVMNDGYMNCTYVFGSDEIITFVDCDSSDGSETYDCAVDQTDGLLHCTYVYGDQSCEEIVQDNELVSSTCPYAEPDSGR